MPIQIDYSDKFYTRGGVRDDNVERIKKYKEMSKKLSPIEKDRLAKEQIELEGKVSSSLMSKDDMWPVKDPDSAVDQQTLREKANELLRREADPVYQNNIKRLRHVRQLLDPDNPEAKSIEYLRGSKYRSRGAEAHKVGKWS